MSTERQKKLGIAIVGGGRGGLALLQLFYNVKDIEILGVADIRSEAAAIQYAQSVNIATMTDFRELIKEKGIDLIVDVTGNPDVRLNIQREKSPQVELLGGTSAKLLWNFIEMLDRKVVERTQELKEAEVKLLQSERLASMGKVAASIGHELRNPLGVIKNSIYYLKMKIKEDPKLHKHLEIMDKEVVASGNIIDDLLNLTRTTELVTTLTDLHRIMDEVLSLTEVPSGVVIEKEFDPQLQPFQVDSDQIRKVFVNMIHNAVQAMDHGGKLKIITCKKEGWAEIKFIDTGKGISPESHKEIFQPFFTTKAKGIGLGLTISKKIIDQHRGTIQVRSDFGKGTTFTISLPITT